MAWMSAPVPPLIISDDLRDPNSAQTGSLIQERSAIMACWDSTRTAFFILAWLGCAGTPALAQQLPRCDLGERTFVLLCAHASFQTCYRFFRSADRNTLDDPEWDLPGPGSTLDRQLSAVCLPRGATITLFAQPRLQGTSITLRGPGEFNLHRQGWGDRARSARIRIQPEPIIEGRGTPELDREADQGPGLPPASPPRGPGDQERFSTALEALRQTRDCETVTQAVLALREISESSESLPPQLARRPDGRTGTVGEAAQRLIDDVVERWHRRCFVSRAAQADRRVRNGDEPSFACDQAVWVLRRLRELTSSDLPLPMPWASHIGDPATMGRLASLLFISLAERNASCGQ